MSTRRRRTRRQADPPRVMSSPLLEGRIEAWNRRAGRASTAQPSAALRSSERLLRTPRAPASTERRRSLVASDSRAFRVTRERVAARPHADRRRSGLHERDHARIVRIHAVSGRRGHRSAQLSRRSVGRLWERSRKAPRYVRIRVTPVLTRRGPTRDPFDHGVPPRVPPPVSAGQRRLRDARIYKGAADMFLSFPTGVTLVRTDGTRGRRWGRDHGHLGGGVYPHQIGVVGPADTALHSGIACAGGTLRTSGAVEFEGVLEVCPRLVSSATPPDRGKADPLSDSWRTPPSGFCRQSTVCAGGSHARPVPSARGLAGRGGRMRIARVPRRGAAVGTAPGPGGACLGARRPRVGTTRPERPGRGTAGCPQRGDRRLAARAPRVAARGARGLRRALPNQGRDAQGPQQESRRARPVPHVRRRGAYLGRGAARADVAGASTPALMPPRRAEVVPVRSTPAHTLVLAALAEQSRLRNCEIRLAAGIATSGETSALVKRLSHRGLIENTAGEGEPNRWSLTPYGRRVLGLLGVSGATRAKRSGAAGARRAA